jgi:hypothetical protein
VQPPPEHVHWLFATGFLALGLCQLGETVVGERVWSRRPWRAYLWPATAFVMGLWLWPVMVLYTNSTIHMLAHGIWAQVTMLAGAVQLGLARGKLKDPRWELTLALAFFVSGIAFLVHEQNGWLFSRSAFLHHALGWTLVAGSVFPLARAFRPSAEALRAGYAATMVAVAVLLFSHRDLAPIFGHLSELAGAGP